MRLTKAFAVLTILFVAFLEGSALGQAKTTGSEKTAAATGKCAVDSQAQKVVVTGNVTDPSGAIVPDANIALKCGEILQQTRSGSDGSFSLTISPGSYELDVTVAGFEPQTQRVSITTQSSQKLDLALNVKRTASIVTVTAPIGYVATSATTATKSDIPLIETPQSVSVITEDQMTSRNVQTLSEAIRYTSSVGVDAYGTETRFDWFNIRGFDESTYGLFRDNSRWQSGQVEGQIDPYELQEVDVIKGPSSVLYGQNTPGGLVNLVTKRPPAEGMGEIEANFGSYDRKQIQGDFGGPLDADQTWRYRLTGMDRASGTQVNYVPDDRWFIAPALTWSPKSKATTFSVLSDYQFDNTGWSQFLPAVGTFQPNPNGQISTSFFTGEPNYDYFHRQQWSIGYLFEHHFSKVWTVRQTSRYSKIMYDGKTAFGGGYVTGSDTTIARYGFGNNLDLGLYTLDTQALAQFKTGPLSHQVLFGVDYSHADSQTISGISFASPLNVFNPVYGSPVPPLFIYGNTDQPSWQTGLYFQDHVNVSKRLILTLSGREDWTDMTTTDRLVTPQTFSEQSPNHFTGRAGIGYLTDFGLAPYFSYSTSFLPTAGVNFYGQPFVPTTGQQYEAGIKYQPGHSESFITASFFNITENNVETPDTTNPLNTVQTGQVRSRGFELEGVASIFHGLNLHGSYSWLDEKNTQAPSEPDYVGKRPTLIPDALFSVSIDYTQTHGPLQGLGGNFGVRYTGTTAGDPLNTFILSSYTLFDASIRYDYKRLRFLVGATNLGDKTYVPICTSISYCNYGFKRDVIGSIRYQFPGWGSFLK